ncbi:MAG TPA: hypothetical protein GXX37_05630 [Clostridiaceae bacterium]|nr:hypothetical protein [Clostridiaceae bacterium]
MKKIGFIDYYIDEWHANNYPQWIAENCRNKGRNMEFSYAFADIDKPGGLDTDSWCKKYGVQRISSIDELVEKSDYIIVLSPDNPEHHERLSKIPLMSGKPVYIDKTFSPDLKTGIRIFEHAEKHGTPMFSSSALRFSKELAEYPSEKVNPGSIEFVATTGPGSFETYSVHQLEMIVSLMGPGARRVKSLSTKNYRTLIIEYPDGRRASMQQMSQLPFQLALQLKNGEGRYIFTCTEFFPRLIDSMLNFFETGKPPVPKEETLTIMALIEAGSKALTSDDTWIEVDKW